MASRRSEGDKNQVEQSRRRWSFWGWYESMFKGDSVQGATVQIMNNTVGTGIIFLPGVLLEMGIYVGVGVLGIVGFLNGLSTFLLYSALNQLRKKDRRPSSLSESGEEAFGRTWGWIIKIVMAVDCFGGVLTFQIVLTRMSLELIQSTFGSSVEIFDENYDAKPVPFYIAGVSMFIITYTLSLAKDFRGLRYISCVSISLVYIFVFAVVFIFFTGYTHQFTEGSPIFFPEFGDFRTYFRVISNAGILTFSHISLCVSNIHAEFEEENLSRVGLSIIWAYPSIFIIYAMISLTGYLSFLDNTDKDNFVLSYRSHSKLTLILRLIVFIEVLLSYPLWSYVIVKEVDIVFEKLLDVPRNYFLSFIERRENREIIERMRNLDLALSPSPSMDSLNSSMSSMEEDYLSSSSPAPQEYDPHAIGVIDSRNPRVEGDTVHHHHHPQQDHSQFRRENNPKDGEENNNDDNDDNSNGDEKKVVAVIPESLESGDDVDIFVSKSTSLKELMSDFDDTETPPSSSDDEEGGPFGMDGDPPSNQYQQAIPTGYVLPRFSPPYYAPGPSIFDEQGRARRGNEDDVVIDISQNNQPRRFFNNGNGNGNGHNGKHNGNGRYESSSDEEYEEGEIEDSSSASSSEESEGENNGHPHPGNVVVPYSQQYNGTYYYDSSYEGPDEIRQSLASIEDEFGEIGEYFDFLNIRTRLNLEDDLHQRALRRRRDERDRCWETFRFNAVSLAIVTILASVLGMIYPNVRTIVGYSGSLTGILLCYVFPVAIYLKIVQPERMCYVWVWMYLIFCIFFMGAFPTIFQVMAEVGFDIL